MQKNSADACVGDRESGDPLEMQRDARAAADEDPISVSRRTQRLAQSKCNTAFLALDRSAVHLDKRQNTESSSKSERSSRIGMPKDEGRKQGSVTYR